MSRSRKKVPICANTCTSSNKKYKQYEHRSERRTIRSLVHMLSPKLECYHRREYGNEWASPRDGKHWFTDILTWDKSYFNKLMRK